MKSLQSKNITPDNSNNSFFQKESSNDFFRKSHKPFFNSSQIQAKLTVNQPNDPYEKEADATADRAAQRLSSPFDGSNPSKNITDSLRSNNLRVQRKCEACEHEEGIQKKEADAPVNTTTASPQSASDVPTVTAARFIVEDNAVPAAGQMRKTDFLNRLREEICMTVNQALAGTTFSSDNCPYIKAAFARHQTSNPLQLEQLIARYDSATAQAQNINDLIQRMKIRVYAAAKEWVKTGGNISGATQVFGSVAGSVSSVIGGVASTVGGIASTIGGILFKASNDNAHVTQSPNSVMQSLGGGRSLDSTSKGKMESAFGTSFSNVEVHTDSNAATLSGNMNARAFTVGNHIAFGDGEHRPGSIEGDALLAHELAHTIQQSGGIYNKNDKPNASAENSFENEADFGAVEAVATIWGGKSKLNKNEIRPKARKGLSISRCTTKKAPPVATKKTIDSMDKSELDEIINNPAKYNLGELGAAKARAMMLQHQEAIAKTGKGTIQGNKCPTPASPGVAQQDCTTYVIEILKFAFKAKGLEGLWNDVFNDATNNSNAVKYGTEKGFKGTELIASLVGKAGWKALFWSPDPRNPADTNSEHPEAYKKVGSGGKYYNIPVEKGDSVVNYRRTSPSATVNKSKLDKLKQVPLAVIGAKGGRHMTVLVNGIVYEVHWDKSENDPNVIEATPLENWGWNSGVLVMPESDYKSAFKSE